MQKRGHPLHAPLVRALSVVAQVFK
jgi:hypothetical protein